MSGIGDFLFGEDATPGRIENVSSGESQVARDEAIGLIRGFLSGGGLNPFEGPTTAPLGDFETRLLGMLEETAGGSFPSIQAGRTAITDIASNTPTTNVNPLFADLINGGGPTNPAQSQIFDILTGATQDPNNEIIQNAITAATRPILEQFGDQVDVNRNQFTRAGQFVQPGSSSPFELAQSRLSTGLANALGDTSSRIIFDNLSQERGRQSNLINTLTGAFDSAENRRVNETGQRLQAATASVPFERGQLDALDSVLETAALPRLIEQFGLEQGREIFEQEQKSLLNLLQLAFQGTTPTIANIPGTPGSSGIAGPLLSGLAAGAGGPIGTAIGAALF